MIGNLTKDQIAKLPKEQQEAVARLVLDESRQRRSILAKAKGYWGRRLVPILLWISASIVWILTQNLIVALLLFTLGVWILVQFHAAGLNRRMDALLLLMDLNRPSKGNGRAEQASLSDGDKPPC